MGCSFSICIKGTCQKSMGILWDSLKMNGWVSDSDVYGQDAGVSIGVEIPLDRSLF